VEVLIHKKPIASASSTLEFKEGSWPYLILPWSGLFLHLYDPVLREELSSWLQESPTSPLYWQLYWQSLDEGHVLAWMDDLVDLHQKC
jgi:hypothetical protein